MPRRVVCVSGPDGTGMRQVAAVVAQKLGFALVDEEIVVMAAERAGIEPSLMADVERRRSFIERTVGGMPTGLDMSSIVATADPHAMAGATTSELRDLIRQAIEETAAHGDVVIVAHAASHALASEPGVLRVLITGSPEVRVGRFAAERGLSEKEASSVLSKSDAGRAGYLKRFYGERLELPTQFDLVVNTDRLTPEAAASLVLLASEG